MMTRRQLIAHAAVAVGGSLSPTHAQTARRTWRTALPGYRYVFPRDHLDHPDFRTEWWYFTGNLNATDGRAFGYELTFFRQGRSISKASASPWDVDQLFLAHLALTDMQKGRFHHNERLNRPGPGLAGVDRTRQLIWNGNWKAQLTDGNRWKIEAVDHTLLLNLELHSLKAPVLHGKNGVHQKSAESGSASHYVSLTRLQSNGTLKWDGRDHTVSGLSWMDHEFFSNLLSEGQVGWDWFSVQFENETELMLFRLRHRDERQSFSGGTFVHRNGAIDEIPANGVEFHATEHFHSQKTNANYPVGWRIVIPHLDMELQASPRLSNQELVSSLGIGPSYWEGAMEFQGVMRGLPIKGKGYLELTGYADVVRMEQDEATRDRNFLFRAK